MDELPDYPKSSPSNYNSTIADDRSLPKGKGYQSNKSFSSDTKNISAALNAKESKFQDVWAMILFWIHFILLVTLVIYSYYHVPTSVSTNPSPDSSDVSLPWTKEFKEKLLLAFGINISVSVVFCILYLLAIYKFPKQMVIGSFISTISFFVICGVLMIVGGSVTFGIILLSSALIESVIMFFWRERIPLTTLLLENTMGILGNYPSCFLAGIINFTAQTVYLVFWVFAFVVIVTRQMSESCQMALFFLLLLSLFWTCQVIANVLHVTIAGAFATFYFTTGSNSQVSNPVASSCKRALTYSFGSICFGSLVISIIQTLRTIFEFARDRDSLIGACLDCLFSCIENLIQFFNYYAFTEIAIYGKSYIQAAKDTWKLIQRSGLQIIINQDLMSSVFFIAMVILSVISSSIGYTIVMNDPKLLDGHKAVIIALSAIIGLVSILIVSGLVQSGTSSTFVCYAEDPEAIKTTKPDFYEKIQASLSGGSPDSSA